MGRVLTNNTALAYAVEQSQGLLPASPVWRLLEPNNITQYGPTISTVARAPITNDRQRRKGTITDLTSPVEFEHDLVLDPYFDLLQRFTYATAVNAEMDILVSAVETTGDSYTVAALTAGQANKLEFSTGQFATLIVGRGFTNNANNGLKQVDTDVAASATSVPVTENLIDETAPANARIELAGLRSLATAADLTWDWDATTRTATLSSAADITDFTVFGLSVGQRVHIGSRNPSTGLIENAFTNVTTNDVHGYARIRSFSSGSITFDKVDTTLRFDVLTAPATAVDIIFGKFVRNLAVDAAQFLNSSLQFEARWANLAEPGPGDEYEYALGNLCNSMATAITLNDKATFTASFAGTDTPAPTGTRATNAATPLAPLGTEAFNTASDIARISVEEVDEDGLSTFFKTLNITLNNNVSPENVLGTLGAAFLNTGDLEVDLDTQVVFTSGLVLEAIRANTTVNLSFNLRNNEASIYFEIPSLTLGGGARDLPRNESVLVNITGTAFRDPLFNTSVAVSFFPIRL